MMRPIDIATRHCVDFIRAYAPAKCDVLEIGCGEGNVAQRLQSFGFNVTAIDADSACVARAQENSVNAVEAHWPDFQSDQVDAILFTRSLHHMHDLDSALSAARMRLREGGVLLVEDFAFYEADTKTSDWFANHLRARPIAKSLTPPADTFVAKILGATEPHAAWRSDHGHELHSIETMATAVAAQLNVRNIINGAYLYRYLIPALPESQEAAALLEGFFNKEELAIASGEIAPIGRRIIASI